MWATLALTALSLAPAQTGQLELTNVRATYGILGPERKDNKLVPGDQFVVAFDIQGLQVKDDGRVVYAMGMELLNKKKKEPEYRQEPQEKETVNSLGGTRLPAFAHAEIGTDQPPGEYVLKVTVIDKLAKKTQVLTRDFVVLPRQFGIVRTSLTYTTGMAAPPLAVPGQALSLNFALVGFELDKTEKDPKKQQPHVTVELIILDSEGKRVLPAPLVADIKEIKPEFRTAMPWGLPVYLNRSGKFRLTVKAADKISGKTAEQSLDIQVVEQK